MTYKCDKCGRFIPSSQVFDDTSPEETSKDWYGVCAPKKGCNKKRKTK